MTTSSSSTADRFEALCTHLAPLAVQASSLHALSHILRALYDHPPRAYHSLTHITTCLDTLDTDRHLASEPDLVEFALFLHDCVYDAPARDNETRSADIAVTMLRELGAPDHTIAAVRTLILATRHTGEPLSGDEALVADIDMAILASPSAEYDAYSRAIRSEFAFAPDTDYRTGRAAFLRSLLARPAIFHTDLIREALEFRARANIARELGTLAPTGASTSK